MPAGNASATSCASLEVNITNEELRFLTQSKRSQVVPLAPPLLADLTALASSDDPRAPLSSRSKSHGSIEDPHPRRALQ